MKRRKGMRRKAFAETENRQRLGPYSPKFPQSRPSDLSFKMFVSLSISVFFRHLVEARYQNTEGFLSVAKLLMKRHENLSENIRRQDSPGISSKINDFSCLLFWMEMGTFPSGDRKPFQGFAIMHVQLIRAE